MSDTAENARESGRPGRRVHEQAEPSRAREALLTADELAARWQVPKAHVYRLAREGRLPTVRIGRYYRWSRAAIEAWELAGGVAADG